MEPKHRHSLRNGFNGRFVISPVSMTLLVTVALRNVPQDLAPAQGRQDHTTWPSASHRTSDDALRPSHPASYVRDDREAPLLWKRNGDKQS